MIRIYRTILFFLLLSLFVQLNGCNTVKGTATGVGRDVKAIWHYGSCTWSWDRDCQKK